MKSHICLVGSAGKDVFVHISAVEKAGFTGLTEGAKVSYEVVAIFKLVFLSSAAGTLLFIVICVAVHLATGGVLPIATEKLVD